MVHNQVMNKRQSKAEMRRELERQRAEFLRQGGHVQQFQPGESGLEDGAFLRPTFSGGQGPRSRTPALEVLATIDARRRQKPTPKASPRRQPSKKIIYDDFGEPLREVWEDT